MEDFSLSESHDDFIILPSQDESQMLGLNEAVSNLPALQFDEQSAEKMEETKVESPSKSNEGDISPIEPVHDSGGDTTCNQQKDNTCLTSPTDSSFQSKQLSNLGSYDQCEVYETQKAHAKGSRFHLFPLSQEDVFGEPEKDTGDEVHISTPAEHIGSLQLSQHPMLVPETEEDTDNMIPPSPEAYGRTPMIIPGSPTQGEEDEDIMLIEEEEEEADYDVTVMNTFTDKTTSAHVSPPIRETEDKKQTDSSSSLEENETVEKILDKEVSSQDFQAALEMPTLIDNDKSESLHLYLTESTQASHLSGKVVIDIDSTSSVDSVPDRDVDNPEIGGDNKTTPGGDEKSGLEGEKKSSDQDITVIHVDSETVESHVDDSQNLSLHLTPSQDNLSNSQIEVGQRTQTEKSQGQKSQGSEKSQGQKSQGSEKSQGQRSQGSKSQGDNSQGVSRPLEGKVRSRRQSREDKLIANINANPLVIWKDESDSERKQIEMNSSKPVPSENFLGFHLSIPKDTPTEPPDPKVPEYIPPSNVNDEENQSTNTIVEEGKNVGQGVEEEKTDESLVELDDEILVRRALTISMIHSDSEPSSQAVFKLDRPQIECGTEEMTYDTEDLFSRKKTTNPKMILDDSEDKGEETVSSMKTNYDTTEEIYIARKLMADDDPMDIGSLDVNTETYKPDSQIETIDFVNIDKDKTASNSNINRDQSQPELSTTLQQPAETVSNTCQPDEQKSELKEMSTQTLDKDTGGLEVVDSVVEKVAKYLQSGIQPRSRASSVCTDWSDSHQWEGSEKGDNLLKTPVSQKREGGDKKLTTPLSRRSSVVDKPVSKSPEEIKNIIQTYSSILSKSKRRRKSGESRISEEGFSCSQRPNPVPDSPVITRTLQPRRLSTQSLPTDLTRSQVLDREDSWMTSRKPNPQISVISELDNTGRFTQTSSQIEAEENKTKTNVSRELEKVFKTAEKDGNNQTEVDKDTVKQNLNENKLEEKPVSVQTNKSDKSVIVIDSEKLTDTSINTLTANTKSELNKSVPFTVISNTKQTSAITSTAQPDPECHVTLSIEGQENANFPSRSPAITMSNTPLIIPKDSNIPTAKRNSLRFRKQRQKKLKSLSERNALHKNSSSPESQNSSGMFTSSTQKFQARRSGTGQDPYTFHGTQSQTTPDFTKPSNSSKKRRLLHRKSGIKKQRSSPDTSHKQHVSFQATSPAQEKTQIMSQQSDVATTTSSGSLQSIPSTISQRSSCGEPILSPSSSGSRQSVAEEITTRLSGKRLSVEQSLPETIPLHHSEEDNYKKVTIVTETVEKLHREITTTRKVVGSDGTVLESTVDVKKMDPVVVEENTHKRVQYIYIPSPSRSATSLTSGDLADISSSLSKSSVSSGSLGSKVSLAASGSLDHVEQNDSSNRQAVDPPNLTQKSGELGSCEESVPSLQTANKPIDPGLPSTSVIMSDQDASGIITPLGSTINKTGSHLHDRTSSVESPKVSDSLFSSSDEKRKRATRLSKPQQEMMEITDDKEPTNNSGDIPHQVQSVSSSSVSDRGDTLITSAGTVGCRVMAKWKDGFYYPGSLKCSMDRYSKCQVRFDDGDSMSVKIQDILLIERLPTGQSVMVLTDQGDFECGLILQQNKDHYKVETDAGTSGSYTFGQVILSSDQASFLISDRGSEIMIQVPGQSGVPVNVGDVSLDNLVDTPRRTSKRVPVPSKIMEEAAEQASSSRGRKRKLDVLKPQATSTPTPKGKPEGAAKRRKVDRTDASPINTPMEVPEQEVKRSPRKTKVGLFLKDTGPLPTKKIFRGLTFLLTHVMKSKDQKDQEKKLLQGSSVDTSTDESSQEEDVNAPFDKDHLKAQIEAGGGNLVENLDEKVLGGKKRCLLLSSTYQRTIKYLHCLAAGVPCISHMWVVDSCTRNERLDEKSYILPAGISLEKRKLVEWKSRDDVFIGVKATVLSKDNKFVETWTNILQSSKCQVYKQLQYADIQVIVTDKSCSTAVERQAGNKNIPLVSTEWVIQSLVNGKLALFRGHPRYRHDFVLT